MAQIRRAYHLYYPPNIIGRAEPIRMLLTELGVQWREPWKESGLTNPEDCFRELDRMRNKIQQEPFATPVLEEVDAVPPQVEQKVGLTQEQQFSPEAQGIMPAMSHPWLLGQTPIILHYLATVLDKGRLLVKGDQRSQHEACQLADDIDDCLTESYTAWNLLSYAGGFVPPEIQSKAGEGTRKWWIETRLPKWLKHFDRFLSLHGERNFIMGPELCYRQHWTQASTHRAVTHRSQLTLMLCIMIVSSVDFYMMWLLDGLSFELPDQLKDPQYDRLHRYQERLMQVKSIQKRLHEREEKYTHRAPGF